MFHWSLCNGNLIQGLLYIPHRGSALSAPDSRGEDTSYPFQTLEVRAPVLHSRLWTWPLCSDTRGEDDHYLPTPDAIGEDQQLSLFHITEVSITIHSSPLQKQEVRATSPLLSRYWNLGPLATLDDTYRLKKRSLYSPGSLQRWM